MRASKRRRSWLGTAELSLAIHANGTKRGAAGARAEMYGAADRALGVADEEEKALYRAEFVDGMDYKMAAHALHLSERTYYRIRGRLIGRVVEELQK